MYAVICALAPSHIPVRLYQGNFIACWYYLFGIFPKGVPADIIFKIGYRIERIKS